MEPFDGAAAMDWVSWDSVGMADNVEWKHKVVLLFIILSIINIIIKRLSGGTARI